MNTENKIVDVSESVDALVIRNIGDIESAYMRALKIGDDIWGAVRSTLNERLKTSGWHVSDSKEEQGEIWFAPQEWLVPGVKPDADPFFSIQEIEGPGQEEAETYLSAFLQNGPSGAGIALWFSSNDMKKRRFRQKYINEDSKEILRLIEEGFRIHDNWIYYPIILDVELVVQGAVDEDYSDALAPLREAIDAVLKNYQSLSDLVKLDSSV